MNFLQKGQCDVASAAFRLQVDIYCLLLSLCWDFLNAWNMYHPPQSFPSGQLPSWKQIRSVAKNWIWNPYKLFILRNIWLLSTSLEHFYQIPRHLAAIRVSSLSIICKIPPSQSILKSTQPQMYSVEKIRSAVPMPNLVRLQKFWVSLVNNWIFYKQKRLFRSFISDLEIIDRHFKGKLNRNGKDDRFAWG